MIDMATECERNGWRLLDFRDENVWPRDKDYPTGTYGWPANKGRGKSRGKRDLSLCTTIMLHTTDVSGMTGERGLGMPCHAYVASDESITLCHHDDRIVYHGHAANRFSYGLEIAGRCDFDAPSQITRARLVIAAWRERRLAAFPGAPCYVMAHRQSHDSRTRDPGPVIWRELGEWAIDELGMLLGPTVGSGRDIPQDWRR